jgi:hypothetical protein
VSRAGWSRSRKGTDTEKIAHLKKQYECGPTLDSIPIATSTIIRNDSSISEFDRLNSVSHVEVNSKSHSPRKERPPVIIVSRFHLMGESSDRCSNSPLSPGKT